MSDVVPDGWSKARLHEVVTKFQNGYAFSAKGYVPEGIPIISMGSILLNGTFKKNNTKIKYWSENARDELSRYIVKPEDLIMAMTDVTPTMELIGRSCIVKGNGEFFLNQRVGLISVDYDRVSKRFLAYLSNYDNWRSYCIGSSGLGAQANLGTTQILDGPVLLPPLPEQKKIAAILSSVDEVIEKTQAQIDKLKDLKTGMMQELLTKGIGHTEFKDSPVGRIPVGWEVVSLDKLLSDVKYPIRSGPFGSALLKHELVEIGIPYLGIDNVHVERFERKYKRFVSEEKFNALVRYAVRENDVMVTIMGTVGRCCVVPKGIGKALSSKHVWTMTFDLEKYLPELICWQINYATWVEDQFKKESQGGVMESISSKTLKSLLVPLQPMWEQRQIAEAHFKMSKTIYVKSSKLLALMKFKKALMQDLLTGKVRVKVDPEAAGKFTNTTIKEAQKQDVTPSPKPQSSVVEIDTAVKKTISKTTTLQSKPKSKKPKDKKPAQATQIPESNEQWLSTIRSAFNHSSEWIKKAELVTLVAQTIQLNRLTANRKKLIQKAINKACKWQVLYKEQGEYCLCGKQFGDYENYILDIQLPKLMRKGQKLEQDELFKLFLSSLGFKRSSAKSQNRFKSYLRSALHRKLLQRVDGLIRRV